MFCGAGALARRSGPVGQTDAAIPLGIEYHLGPGPGLPSTQVPLLVVVLHFDRFQVFSFKYLTTIQAFEIIDALPAGDNLGTGVIASGRHILRLAEVYFKRDGALVKPFLYTSSAWYSNSFLRPARSASTTPCHGVGGHQP
jgi:hypothetical protein